MSDEVTEQVAAGLDRAARELGVDAEVLRPSTNLAEQYRELAEAGADLVLIDPDIVGPDIETVIAAHPDTTFAVIEGATPPAGAHAVTFADEHTGYLAGVVAGSATGTRVVGFVGDVQDLDNERVRAGFEAGVHSIDPDMTVLATYMGTVADGSSLNLNRANAASDGLYERGADVVFASAGDASLGVFEAALDQTLASGWDVFAIGSGSDWSKIVSANMRTHVVGSVVRRWDVAIFEAIRALADGDPPRDALTLTAADGALGLATSHVNAVDRVPRRVAESIDEIRTGDVTVPFAPTGEVIAPPRADVIDVATVTWDGRVCTAETLSDVASGATARVEFVNTSSEPRGYVVQHGRRGVQIATITPPDARTVGYTIADTGPLDLGCTPAARDHLPIDSAHTVGTVEVRSR